MSDALELSELDLRTDSGEWGALAQNVGNVFATPEWIGTWWRHYGRGRAPLNVACRRTDGALAAVLPLYMWRRRPLRVARFLGHGPGDALGPLCQRDDRPAVASALLSLLAERRVAMLVGENLPREEGWSALFGAHDLSREASPVLSLDGVSWESLLASFSKNLRYRIRSRERKLADGHRVHYRLAEDPERFEEDFERFVQLHRARWPDGSSFTAAEPFHRDFARLAFERGWCRLWLLEVDGEACAAWYGFRFANVESYYQLGRDPGFDAYSVGFLVLAHSIRQAAVDGAREYRFLRGGEDFKYRFATHDHGLETFAVPIGGRGRVAMRAALVLPRPILRRLA